MKREKALEKAKDYYDKIYDKIIKLYEQYEKELEGKFDQGATDFKLLAFEQYFNSHKENKEKKEPMIKLYKIVNTFFKTEVEDIGLKIIYKYLSGFINLHPNENISETNIRAFTELLTYINENCQRVGEIWNINVNNTKNEKPLIKNSIELLGYYSFTTLYSYQSFIKYLNENHIQDSEYLMQLRKQSDILPNQIKLAIDSIKVIEKDKISNNRKDTLLEQYLFFIIQVLYLFFLIKHKNMTAEEISTVCNTFFFVLRNSSNLYLYQLTLKYLEGMIRLTDPKENVETNPYNIELLKDTKKYLNEKNYLKDRYNSDNKYVHIIKFILKYYLYFFNKLGNIQNINPVFKELYKNIIADNFFVIKELASKINDFRLPFELKCQMIYLIYFVNDIIIKEKKESSFEDIYFFMKQFNSFYQTLIYLSNEFMGSPIKEEKQLQKEIYQKNMLKVNIEEEDYNSTQKINLNHFFLVLLNNKYDKYIYIEEQKYLNDFMKNSLNIIKNLIDVFKSILSKKENADNQERQSYLISRFSVQLSKFFYSFYFVYEKNKVNHQNHELQSDLIDKLIEIYLGLSHDILVPVFRKLMPFILKLYKLGNKISPIKNSISNKLIHNIFKTVKDNLKTREILFKIYFEYFSTKIYETGNPTEYFNLDSTNISHTTIALNESINNITILKSIFFNLLDCVTSFEYFRNKIIPLIIDFLYLSKNAEYYGNYIYILRCFFKYFKTAINQVNNPLLSPNEKNARLRLSSDFNIEINYILYAIIKYLLNIKEKTPFLSDIISEIIMIMPVKFKFLSEIPHLIFPSLVDSLSNSTDNIQLCLGNLENWMSIYVKRPESVVPFLEKNLTKITDFLSNNLLRPLYINVCLVSLKWLSKLGGKGRNYLEKKKIMVKTCPNQILTLKLKEKNSERTMDFVLDSIIDVCNNLNSSNKNFHKKGGILNDKNIFINYIEIYKNCLTAFFNKKIDYDYIIEIKKNIIKGIDFNKKEFESEYSFKIMNEKNSKIKVNSIFRKIEHFLVGKIMTGFFLINSTFNQFQNNQKELNAYGNNLMKFMSDYFVLILLSKEKNNQNMLLFELDPVLIIDQIIHYLFSTHPTIIRNSNTQYTDYSLKIIKYILDSINTFFDHDNKIIKNLEIVEIIYMKLLNCCYVNDSQKKDSGLILIKILLQKFGKEVNHKYLKYFFKCLSSVTSNYSNIITIQFKKGSNIMVEVIESLIKMFILNEENYSRLNEEYLKDDKNIKEEMLSDEEKGIIINEKNNFIMFFDFIKYAFDEIVEQIDSPNNYTRNLGIYLLNKIIGNIPKLKKLIPILLQMDISNLTIIEFFKYIKEANSSINYENIIFNVNNNIGKIHTEERIKKDILNDFISKKIYKKLDFIFNGLTRKLGLREAAFSNLITYSDSLNNLFSYCPILIEEYICSSQNIKLFLEVIKALYFNLLISFFNYCQISQFFQIPEGFKTKLIFLYMEQLLIEKNLTHEFKIKDKNGKEIIILNEVKDEYIELIEKYVFENQIFRNEVNTRDHLIAELFEFLGLKINMIHQYIKVLNNIFNTININEINIKENPDKVREEFNKYKKKSTKLIFLKIFNLHSSSILKECSSYLCKTFKKDTKLRDEIYSQNYNKISSYIDKINERDIRESKCGINQDNNNTTLQKDHINALLIVCKCIKLDEHMTSEITKKLTIFENYLEERYENSQVLLFYGYISLFLYIDAKEQNLNSIFRQLVNRIKESILYYKKNLLNFIQTKHHKQIIKLIFKYRHSFSKFILSMCDNKSEHKYIYKLIRNLVYGDRSTLIYETIMIDIAKKIKNEIIINHNIKTEKEKENDLDKLVYLLKISKMISLYSPIFLRKTSFIEIIDDYIKNLIIKFNANYQNMHENIKYEKVIKYWLDLNKIHIEIFKERNKYLVNLFFYKSMENMSQIEKNKIAIFISYYLNNIANDKSSEKKFQSIMTNFIKLDKDIQKYFDYFVNYLIIPMMVKYLKYFNYFRCFSVSINKENSLKINVNSEKKEEKEIKKGEKIENENNKEENYNSQTYDEEYLINIIESLTLRLNEIIFDNEKKEEAKYKLLTLIIAIYIEYIKQKGNNFKYSDKTEKIYYTIQTLLTNSPFYLDKNGLGIWKIYLLLGNILFSSQEENENNNKIIYDFYKKLNEDYNDIENLAYEIILSNSKTDDILEKFYTYYLKEGNFGWILNLLKIILKFPYCINKAKESTIKNIINYILDISPKLSKTSLNVKKLLVQTLGLIISYVCKQKDCIAKKEKSILQIQNIPDIDKRLLKVSSKLFEILFNNDSNDTEILEILKKLTVYIRELFNYVNTTEIFKIYEQNQLVDSAKYIHIYIQLLKIFYLNIKNDNNIYKNADYIFKLFNAMNIKNSNYRYINDCLFIIRLLLDIDILMKLNNRQNINEITIYENKLLFIESIEALIKDKNIMNKKYTNYDIKDLFNTSNYKVNYANEDILKRILNYLILNKLYIDRSQTNLNNPNNNPINNAQNNLYYNQQLQTTNTTVETHQNPPQNGINPNHQIQQQINNIRNIVQNNNSNQQAPINDKWLETFHINDFKLFILYRRFFDEFYTTLNNTITNISNINLTDYGPNNYNLNSLKERFEKKLNGSQDIIELMHSHTYEFFENFYCFTLFFLREYKFHYDFYYKKGYFNYLSSMNKEIKEYFSTSHNYYFNLRSFEDLKKVKTETIECILNDKDKDKNKIVNFINNIFIAYPDIILSGFLFFFECKEIVEKYYNSLLELFLYAYRHFRDKFYDPLLEHLLNAIMFNKYLKDKQEEKNRFIFKLLNSIELLNPYKMIRTSENLLLIFINYIKYNLKDPNFNKKDPKILQLLRIILYNATKFELSHRKYIYELIKLYIGENIVDCIKWIFSLDDEGDNEIYTYIFYESIPISIDILLSYFQEGIPLQMNTNNYSKFKSLNKFNFGENKMDIEDNSEISENDYKEYDKNNFIRNIVDNCNSITKDKKVEDILDPIRTIILIDNYSYCKIFNVFFPQIWRMLSMNEREIITIYINEFLYKYGTKSREKNNQIINLLFETFSQCTPVIYIKPIIMQSLIQYQNYWCTNILYLENLLISGIDIPSTYNLLINIFYSLKEKGLSDGLKYYFSKGENSKEAISEIQGNNYLNAENLFYKCFNELKENILDKINIENLDENSNISLSNDELETFNDLSSWENGLIECYQNNDKWGNIIELSDINNNNSLKLKGLWYYGSEKWKDLDIFTKNISQYKKPEKGLKSPYIVQINEIFSMFSKLMEENSIGAIIDSNKYQSTCMNCIRNIYQDFSGLYPKNIESIDYYYFLIFQLAVESWESMNTLNETLKKIREGAKCNFKDNLLLWRERLPHYCEGIKALKCILEPRNYLFNTLKGLLHNQEDNIEPNFIDKVWNDMIYLKYSRKLNLTETFYEKLKLFEQENRNKILIYPYEIYCKNIEYIKFLRNNIHNYDLGVKICDEYIKSFSSINTNEEKLNDFISFALNNFKKHKAYFYYKKGNIFEAHKLFDEASIYKNKESIDYHLYYDWAEMCEEISLLIKEDEDSSEWFENTIHNFFYSIIYKLDKAKVIIPRMITFIKEFKNESLKDRFNEEINQIPSWIWIFWLPILFENFNYYQKDNNKNYFFFTILKKVAINYKQIFYYPFTIYENILNDKFENVMENPLGEKYKELKNIIYSENKYDHCIDKIKLIVEELTKKEKLNQENSLNSILNLCEILIFKKQNFSEVKMFFENVGKILKNFPDLVQFKNNFEQLMNNPEITRNKLRECVIKNKYYNHNLIVTENKFKKLSKLCEESLHNLDFSNIELPGYFSNKIEEPTEQNKIYISKFESEYSHKFITDARSKVLIKCSNDKLLNFIIVNQDADKNIDMKIYMMQILFNSIFAKNYQTYKRKVCFITPIKYHISSKKKIVEEDINIKYNMDEVYEYCLQKRGYSPKIANQIFEEEAKKLNVNTDLVYYSSDNNEKLFYKMCKILPQDSLKNFIHKIILTSEEILIFRKQFTSSYSINNLLSFIFLDNIILKNISFNKETGFCTFNSDLTLPTDNEYKEIIEQKDGTPLRLTKNISFFLSITSIYGIIPGVFYFSCSALLNKPKVLKSILKICLDKNNNNDKTIDKIVQNYINKFKFVLNIADDKDFDDSKNLQRIQNNEMNHSDIFNKEKETANKNKQMKIIYELIENSMKNDNLKKKTIDYEAWF